MKCLGLIYFIFLFIFTLIQFSYNEHKDVEIVINLHIHKNIYHAIYVYILVKDVYNTCTICIQ
jgi:hypothetical protein